MRDRNPQHEQMADESMVRGLAAQARAIWPQESAIVERYALADDSRVLDIGCGTGEISSRLARALPGSRVVGVDLIDAHLELARRRHAELAGRLRFENGDAFELAFDDGSFDLVVCRHMLQSIPQPERVLGEMRRVAKPGGRLHVLSEDYALIQFHPVALETDRFWQDGPITYGATTGTDLRFGRKTWSAMHRLGIENLEVHYVVVDTVRVPRETIREIWLAWRDGYTEVIARHTAFSREQVDEYWRVMLECIDRPDGYMAWHVPIVTGTA